MGEILQALDRRGFAVDTPTVRTRSAIFGCLLAAAALLGLAASAAAGAEAPPATTRIVHTPGTIVPIPASIPHEAGDMVDNRIVPDLRWIAARYPIYVTDGYSGPLPSGEHVGCDECHVHGSDHYNGVAVDVVPIPDTNVCGPNWAPITALALWAEPVQNEPVAPFRWVGYEGDAGHGCGNHLHLSWNHAPAAQFELAEWVEVFPVGPGAPAGKARGKSKPVPPLPTGPKGGISLTKTGGVSAHYYD
jgi:hypothetical protein